MHNDLTIVITDLTRFKNKDLLCMAGLTQDGQTCIRPMRAELPSYLTYNEFKKNNLLPGSILQGTFSIPKKLDPTHPEDRHFSSLNIIGTCTSTEFKNILDLSSYDSVSKGFGIKPEGKIIIGIPQRSIFTLELPPQQFRIVQDKYDANKIKAHFTDGDGIEFSFLPITDLGFFDFVGNVSSRKVTINDMNSFIKNQSSLYLRVGLSRTFTHTDGRSGLWIQVNGIYTFPNFEHVLRTY